MLLLLHGQPGSSRDWQRVVAALDSQVEVLATDRPGWDGTSEPCDLECNCAAALQALDRAGVQRATIVGYSLGAAVAARIAATNPERVARLVLIAPAANTESLMRVDYLLAAPLLGELASAAAMAAAGAALAARPLRRVISSELEVDSRYLGRAARRLLSPSTWSAFVAEQRMLVRELPLLEPLLRHIMAPTTIVIGSADRVVPPSSAAVLAQQIANAELIEIEDANHLLLQQHPERLAEILLA
ncbi:MAG: alpha/beta hydrolase [Solirubrobacterales bacterium]|nr:alpha/beta hydrolase [Solirubrobacterales bacterium]